MKSTIYTYQDALDLIAAYGGGGWAYVNTVGELLYSGIHPGQFAYAVIVGNASDIRYQAGRDAKGFGGAFAAVNVHFPGTDREDIEVV